MALNAWTTSGTMMLFYLAALQSIPTDVYEAAAIDSASRWRTFWKITFPLLQPAHFFVAVVSVIGALKVFDQAFIVSNGSGGPDYSTLTAVLYLYRTAIADIRFGYAAAIGVALFVGIFAITLLQRLLFGRPETAVMATQESPVAVAQELEEGTTSACRRCRQAVSLPGRHRRRLPRPARPWRSSTSSRSSGASSPP